MAQGIRDSEIPGEAWRSLERLGESLEAKRDHFFSRIDQNCTKNRPWRPRNRPRRLPNRRKINPGGSKIDPGRPGGSQGSKKCPWANARHPFWGGLGIILGPPNGQKIDKKRIFCVTFFACVFLTCFFSRWKVFFVIFGDF